MRELNTMEMNAISGAGDLTTNQRIEGAVWGFMDGLVTGVAIGGKVSGSGGFIAGAVNQLVSAIIGIVGGGLFGAIGGFMVGREDIGAVCHDYRETFGSASQAFGTI